MRDLSCTNLVVDEFLRAHPTLMRFADYLYEIAAKSHGSLSSAADCLSGGRGQSGGADLVLQVDELGESMIALDAAIKETPLSEEEGKALNSALGMIAMSVMGMEPIPFQDRR